MKVYFENKDVCFFGTLILTVKSTVNERFDLAYVENNGVTMIGFLNELKYIK